MTNQLVGEAGAFSSSSRTCPCRSTGGSGTKLRLCETRATKVSIICPKGAGAQESVPGARRNPHLSPPAAARCARRAGLSAGIFRRAVLGNAPHLARMFFTHGFDVVPCLQSAGSDFPHRRLLQIRLRDEIRVRSPRHQSRTLRSEVQAQGLLLSLLARGRTRDLRYCRHLHRDQQFVSRHRHRARKNAAGARFCGAFRAQPRTHAHPAA